MLACKTKGKIIGLNLIVEPSPVNIRRIKLTKILIKINFLFVDKIMYVQSNY